MQKLKIVAPASTMKDLNFALRAFGEKNLQQLGFETFYAQHVDDDFLGMAGNVAVRLSDLTEALLDPDIDGVMTVYGGYNSNQLLPAIDYEKLYTQTKPFIGYSDITALLVNLSQKTKIACYHGPGFASFCDPNLFEYTKTHFLKALSGEAFSVADPLFYADDLWYLKDNFGPREIKKSIPWMAYNEGVVTAPISGGNVDTLCALAGTPYFPDLQNKLLFLEDSVGQVNVFHRNMMQLKQMGVFDMIAGLILGNVPETSPLNQPDVLFAVLTDILGHKNFPTLCYVHCSHVDPMLTIPLERMVTLHATSRDSFMYCARE